MGGIEAAVHHSQVVEIGQGAGQRRGQSGHLLGGQRPRFGQGPALHHPGPYRPVGGVDQLHHARVAGRGQGLCFGLSSLAALRVYHEP